MHHCSHTPRKSAVTTLGGVLAVAMLAGAAFADYPPTPSPSQPSQPIKGAPIQTDAIIFSNTHIYGFGTDPTAVIIRVDVHNNYFGDFTKYHWVYTVHNNSYDPIPGVTNGFTGFETMLPAAVPDIANISAPDGIGPWVINTYSGAPVEWDLPNFVDNVGGGTMPGQIEVYGFSTLPRLIVPSTGWFHTWQSNVQTDIVNYPPGNEIEVPDVLSHPGTELCCYQDATGAFICVVLPAGQCQTMGGVIVANCSQCPGIVPNKSTTWGKVKKAYR